MSQLRIYASSNPSDPDVLDAPEDIAAALGARGVRFERWPLPEHIGDDVLATFRGDVDRILDESGFATADVIGLTPEHPDRAALRAKFLDEHTHSEHEVRFFVEGAGEFSLHLGDEVVQVRCEAGDLLSVPAGTPHWFDMGPAPHFTCIRFFTTPAGWVAEHTGDDIAARFPRFG